MGILDIFKSKKEGIHITDIDLYKPGQFSNEFHKTKGKMRGYIERQELDMSGEHIVIQRPERK